MLHHHCRRNPELQEELQIQAAVAAGDVHTVRKMLEQGYSPNGRDANGWTLLHFSAARGKERCVRVFLEHGGELPRERNLDSHLTAFYPNSHCMAFQHQLVARLLLIFFPLSLECCFISVSIWCMLCEWGNRLALDLNTWQVFFRIAQELLKEWISIIKIGQRAHYKLKCTHYRPFYC